MRSKPDPPNGQRRDDDHGPGNRAQRTAMHRAHPLRLRHRPGPVETRGRSATLAALRQARQGATDDYRGDAFLFVKGNPRNLRTSDAVNVFKALQSHGAGDEAFLEMGESYDEALRDGEVSVGIFALPVEG